MFHHNVDVISELYICNIITEMSVYVNDCLIILCSLYCTKEFIAIHTLISDENDDAVHTLHQYCICTHLL